MLLAALALAQITLPTHLVNGDFSSGLTHWTRVTYGAEPAVEIDSQVKHSGSHSLRVSAAAASDTALAEDVALAPGKFYKLSAWVKTSQLEPGNAQVFGTIQAQTLSNGGPSILATGSNHSGDTDWTQETIYFTAPSNGRTHIALFFAGWGNGTGTAWFDDVVLQQIQPDSVPLRVADEALCPGRINPMQYGQFIEYLCTLVPGMWAEKLYDTSFEGLTPYKFRFVQETDDKEMPWYPYGQVRRMKVEHDHDTKIAGDSSERIEFGDGPRCEGGVAQDGISLKKGERCNFHVYLKGTGVALTMKVRLFHGTTEFASATLPVSGDWQKVSAVLDPTGTSENATLSITFQGPGTAWLDSASLMPVNSELGWRKDVVAALKALKPGVIRVGGSVLDDPNLGTFEWTDTIGDPDKRTPFRAWGGLQPTGAGLEEIVQLCHLVGAEPLICVRYEKKAPQDAAKEVEYFNGAVTTPMGALRAKNGHPEPYAIKYWQIGNERWGEAYWRAVPQFAQAMLEVDPNLRLLTSFPSEELIKLAAPYVRLVSPHQYDAENLAGEKNELDEVRRMIRAQAGGKDLKVGVTEWNTTAGDVGLPRAMLWDLENALACSRYHNLLHREADLVELANRSNLTNSFCSGIIQTNRSSMYLTSTYYAQYLYSNLAGNRPLKIYSDLPADMAPDTSATLSEDGQWLTIFFVNKSLDPVSRPLDLSAFGTHGQTAEIWTLTDTKHKGEQEASNSFEDPERVVPVKSSQTLASPKFTYAFPSLSLTVLRWRVEK